MATNVYFILYFKIRFQSREKQLPMKIEPNDEPMDVVPPVEEDLVKPDVGHFDETLLTCDVCLAIMHVPVKYVQIFNVNCCY